MRYLDCPEGSFPWKIQQLLEVDGSAVQIWHDLDGDQSCLPSRGLVLSSSARVTSQTVVVRYSELVTFNGTSWNRFEIGRQGVGCNGILPF